MLFLSIFLAGFTLGIFAALKIFAPEKREELWDPQHFPNPESAKDLNGQAVTDLKPQTAPSL